MQEVKVIDKFLTEEELSIISSYTDRMAWTMQVSRPEDMDGSGIDFLYSDVNRVEYFNSYLFQRVKDYLETDVELDRVYFNGQWNGREGEMHIDACDITVLIYTSKYQPKWGGFTQIFLDDDKEVVVSPQRGRMVIFPSNCFHKAYSFAYQTCPMRISLTYKLLIKP